MARRGIKRYLFTAAQASRYEQEDDDGEISLEKWAGKGQDAKLNQKLYDGFRTFRDEHEAELQILPMQGCSIKEDIFHESVAKLSELKEPKPGFTRLNNNVTLTDIVVPPQNVDPATSRKHLTAKYKATLIYPHTKQRMCPVPSSPRDLPRFLVTTGAITLPNYAIDMKTGRGSDRANQAIKDHKFGGVYVEIIDEDYFLFRIINANIDGKFADLGMQYDGSSKPKRIGVEALVLGDIHWTEHDEDTIRANYEMIETLRPKKIILHDLFTGRAISHHNLNQPLERAKQYGEGHLILREEMESLYEEVIRMSKAMKGKDRQIFVVHSNHDDFLDKYLESGAWRDRDLWNAGFCSELYGQIIGDSIEKDMYLKEALSKIGKIPSNVNFLGLNNKLFVRGYNLSIHGHLGANGSKGMSTKAVDETLGKAVIGHKHAPEIFRDSYVVGTSSRRDLKYMKGQVSAAMGANLVIYENERAQMLPIIEGNWREE